MNLNTYRTRISPLKNKLYRFALSIVGDPSEAEDVVQEVFIKVWRQWEEVDRIDNLEAWCMKLIKNRSIDHQRSKHRRTESIDQVFQLAGDTPTPYEQTAEADGMARIQRLMERLPAQQRQVMQLRDIEGMSYQEIGEALELSVGQVKVNLFRARQHMREFILKSKTYEH